MFFLCNNSFTPHHLWPWPPETLGPISSSTSLQLWVISQPLNDAPRIVQCVTCTIRHGCLAGLCHRCPLLLVQELLEVFSLKGGAASFLSQNLWALCVFYHSLINILKKVYFSFSWLFPQVTVTEVRGCKSPASGRGYVRDFVILGDGRF